MTVVLNFDRKAVEVNWNPQDGHPDRVVVYAQGADGEWHNTDETANDGKAVLTYPADFVGASLVQVRSLDGEVLDSGIISIG